MMAASAMDTSADTADKANVGISITGRLPDQNQQEHGSVLIVGLPGSGKKTLAKALLAAADGFALQV